MKIDVRYANHNVVCCHVKVAFLLLLCAMFLSCSTVDRENMMQIETNTDKEANDMSNPCEAKKNVTVRWDFSQGHEFTNATGFDDICYLEKDILGLRDSSLELLLPDGVIVSGQAFQSVSVNRSGLQKELTSHIHIQYISTPMTIDETYVEMHKIAEKYDIPTENLESWYRRIQEQTGPYVRPSFIVLRLSDNIGLSFDMAYSPAYDKPAGTREYVINLSILWQGL